MTEKSRYQMTALDEGDYGVVYQGARKIILFKHPDKKLVAEQLRQLRNISKKNHAARNFVRNSEVMDFVQLLPQHTRPSHGED